MNNLEAILSIGLGTANRYQNWTVWGAIIEILYLYDYAYVEFRGLCAALKLVMGTDANCIRTTLEGPETFVFLQPKSFQMPF